MGMIRRFTVCFILLSSILLTSGCSLTSFIEFFDFNTADLDLADVPLKKAVISGLYSYYLAQDGTLYSAGADSDAHFYVVYEDQKQGIVAKNVQDFGVMSDGGYYISTSHELYLWSRYARPIFGFDQARTTQKILSDVKWASAYWDALIFCDQNDTLFFIGRFMGETFTVDSPKKIAESVTCASIYQDCIVWADSQGKIHSLLCSDYRSSLLADIDNNQSFYNVKTFYETRRFAVVLSGEELFYYGDLECLDSSSAVGEQKAWHTLATEIVSVSVCETSIAALDKNGSVHFWGKYLSNDKTQVEEGHYSYANDLIVAYRVTGIHLGEGGCYFCYLDEAGRAYSYHSGGWTDFYGNATADKVVGFGRMPNTWVKKGDDSQMQTSNQSNALPVGEYKLVVTGKEHYISEKYMVFQERADHSSTVELPFVTVLESLGAKIGRSSGEVTELEWNGKKYLLNNVRATLVAEGTNFNCIIPAPGSKVSHQIVDGVFLLDWVSIRTVTEMMGISIKAEIDYQNHIVVIDKAS